MTPDAVEVVFPARWTDEKIAAWLMARWRGNPDIGLHMPLSWRDSVSSAEWRAFGHLPTWGVTGEAYALGPDGPVEFYRRRRP